MQVGPILRSMRHHKGAFSLLVLEVAFGFVILVHTVIAARYYHFLASLATGMPVDDLVIVHKRFLHPHEVGAARAEARADMAAFAALPGIAAVSLDAPPLPDGVAFPVVLNASAGDPGKLAWPVHATPGIIGALGLELVAGEDPAALAAPAAGTPPRLLVTRTLATTLYGGPAAAIGRTVDVRGRPGGRVVGVVSDFVFRGTWVPNAAAILVAIGEPASEQGLVYVLRGPSDRRADTLARVRAALRPSDAIVAARPLVNRETRYVRISNGAVVILVWTGFLVVAVALAGSLALSSFSVAERTRQIGVRRALGARRSEIIAYFLVENLILTCIGLLLGLALGAALNFVLRQIMSEIVPTIGSVILSAAIFVVTGMLSALVPARRAARIPPWAATRTL
jgi:putative ABC transport system permease protein